MKSCPSCSSINQTSDNNTTHRSTIVTRVYHSLAAISWVSWKYADSADADDYVQTLLIAKSLIASGGFHHADLVSGYRARPGYFFEDSELQAGGVHPDYKGQVAKLIQSDDPLFEAVDGVSDGAAMKVAAAAAFYVNNFEDLVKNIDRITRITHGSVEARLSAVLIAIRTRQVFLGNDTDNMDRLVEDITLAADILQLNDQAAFFLKRVNRARNISRRRHKPANLLYRLSQKVGLEHLAWSTPITACFWSFQQNVDFSQWFDREHEKQFYLPRNFMGQRRIVNGQTLSASVHNEDVEHLHNIGQYEDYHRSHGYHWRKSIDIDTFLSITISIMAARDGLKSVEHEVPQSIAMFGDDLWALAEQLTPRINS